MPYPKLSACLLAMFSKYSSIARFPKLFPFSKSLARCAPFLQISLLGDRLSLRRSFTLAHGCRPSSHAKRMPDKSAVTAKLIALYSHALKNKGMSDAAAAAADSAVQTYKSHFLSDSAYMPAKISVSVVSSPAMNGRSCRIPGA